MWMFNFEQGLVLVIGGRFFSFLFFRGGGVKLLRNQTSRNNVTTNGMYLLSTALPNPKFISLRVEYSSSNLLDFTMLPCSDVICRYSWPSFLSSGSFLFLDFMLLWPLRILRFSAFVIQSSCFLIIFISLVSSTGNPKFKIWVTEAAKKFF